MGYKQALKHYIDATNTHQFTNVQACLDDGAVYWFSDRTCSTMAEIRAYFEHAWELIQDEVYCATDVEWIAVDEQAAVCFVHVSVERPLSRGAGSRERKSDQCVQANRW